MLKRTLPIAFRMLPLAGAFLLMAAEDNGCIIINNDDDDDDDCVDLDDACPNLECPAGNVVVDGCEICECADVCEPGPAPECANARLTDDCEWVCGGDECISDADCGEGFFCAFFDGAESPAPGEDAADRFVAGTCLPLNPPEGCRSDADCGRGFVCDFSVDNGGSGGGGVDPDAPNDEPQAPEPAPPAPEGTCVPAPGCFDDSDCERGQHCEFFGAENGLVAPGGICVDDVVSECESDADCNGGTCILECHSDPNCPECDVCLFIGTCVDTGCFSDADCHSDQFCDVSGQGERRPCVDSDGDNLCDDALIAIEGVCRDLETQSNCFSDDDCGRDQFCDFGGQAEPEPCFAPDENGGCADRIRPAEGICRDRGGEGCLDDADCGPNQICAQSDACVCDTECRDDGQGGCLPCECPNLPGVCIDLGGGDECLVDEDCARGQRCELTTGGCDEGPHCEIGPDGEEICFGCDPFVIGVCVDDTAPTDCFSDTDCGDNEFCAISNADPAPCFAPDCANRPAPAGGTCQPINTDVCATVRCASGTHCEVDAAGNAVCAPDAAGCFSDQECSDGLVCNAGIDVCESAPGCEDGDNCIDVCYGFCVEATRN